MKHTYYVIQKLQGCVFNSAKEAAQHYRKLSEYSRRQEYVYLYKMTVDFPDIDALLSGDAPQKSEITFTPYRYYFEGMGE